MYKRKIIPPIMNPIAPILTSILISFRNLILYSHEIVMTHLVKPKLFRRNGIGVGSDSVIINKT